MPGTWEKLLRLGCIRPENVPHDEPPRPLTRQGVGSKVPIVSLASINEVVANKGCASIAVLRIDKVSADVLSQHEEFGTKEINIPLDMKMSQLKALNSSPFRAVEKIYWTSQQSEGQEDGDQCSMAQVSLVSFQVVNPTALLSHSEYVDALMSSLEENTPLSLAVSSVTAMLMCGNPKEAISITPPPDHFVAPTCLESRSLLSSTVARGCWFSSLDSKGTVVLVPAILMCHFCKPENNSLITSSSVRVLSVPDAVVPPVLSVQFMPERFKPPAGREDLLSHVPVIVTVVNLAGQV
jgi:hypothetical protein